MKRARNAFKLELITCLMRGGCCIYVRSGSSAQTRDFFRCELSGFVRLGREIDVDLYFGEGGSAVAGFT
jgi:hypothetical protein